MNDEGLCVSSEHEKRSLQDLLGHPALADIRGRIGRGSAVTAGDLRRVVDDAGVPAGRMKAVMADLVQAGLEMGSIDLEGLVARPTVAAARTRAPQATATIDDGTVATMSTRTSTRTKGGGAATAAKPATRTAVPELPDAPPVPGPGDDAPAAADDAALAAPAVAKPVAKKPAAKKAAVKKAAAKPVETAAQKAAAAKKAIAKKIATNKAAAAPAEGEIPDPADVEDDEDDDVEPDLTEVAEVAAAVEGEVVADPAVDLVDVDDDEEGPEASDKPAPVTVSGKPATESFVLTNKDDDDPAPTVVQAGATARRCSSVAWCCALSSAGSGPVGSVTEV